MAMNASDRMSIVDKEVGLEGHDHLAVCLHLGTECLVRCCREGGLPYLRRGRCASLIGVMLNVPTYKNLPFLVPSKNQCDLASVKSWASASSELDSKFVIGPMIPSVGTVPNVYTHP